MRRSLLIATLMVLPLGPAFAQGFSPLSGPNTPVPSPVCDLINFGFCPQPPAPPPLLPDPNAPPAGVLAAQGALPPPPPAHRVGTRVHHRRHPVAE